jgi:hypothetical protein
MFVGNAQKNWLPTWVTENFQSLDWVIKKLWSPTMVIESWQTNFSLLEMFLALTKIFGAMTNFLLIVQSPYVWQLKMGFGCHPRKLDRWMVIEIF